VAVVVADRRAENSPEWATMYAGMGAKHRINKAAGGCCRAPGGWQWRWGKWGFDGSGGGVVAS